MASEIIWWLLMADRGDRTPFHSRAAKHAASSARVRQVRESLRLEEASGGGRRGTLMGALLGGASSSRHYGRRNSSRASLESQRGPRSRRMLAQRLPRQPSGTMALSGAMPLARASEAVDGDAGFLAEASWTRQDESHVRVIALDGF